ncbi:TPA: hypothetical protein ACH3X2_003720 [Trebouxia sp. C0005]
MASSPEHLQALIDALSSYCALLHMEISVPKTKVLTVSPVPVPTVAFSCNSHPVEQVTTFKYLGLHFNQSGCLGACLAIWLSSVGMHSPRVAAANRARLDLQRLYDHYLRTICDLLPSTPHRILLLELGLLPLQVLW